MARAGQIAVLLAAALLWPATGGARQELVVDLSQPEVAITAGFAGSSLMLFGATAGQGDVVVVVRGPKRDTVVRKKQRVAGIWMNRDSVTFAAVPFYYAIASSRPLDEILNTAQLKKYRIGTDNMGLTVAGASVDKGAYGDYHQALVRNKQRLGLYAAERGHLDFRGNRLFRTQLWFPSNVTVGSYDIDTLLVRGGKVVETQTTQLNVHKVGIESKIFDFAHRHPLPYGVLAILIAAMAGWLASFIFRKR